MEGTPTEIIHTHSCCNKFNAYMHETKLRL